MKNLQKSRHSLGLIACFTACCITLSTLPSELRAENAESIDSQVTSDFRVMHTKAVQWGRAYGPERVLLVFDIDNTLLAMNQNLGSDQWFGWQKKLQKESPNSPALVAKDFPGLLKAQGLLFTLGHMHAPQPDAPKLVSDLQSRGFPTLVLTSRGSDFRPATQRELKRSGYDFAQSALPVTLPACELFAPYRLENVSESGLTAEEAKAFGLKKPRKVSMSHGVFMSAGQHKGAMLLTILAKSKREISAVVFIDDNARHTKAVYNALANRNIPVATFRYSREDQRVEAFLAADKETEVRHWNAIQKAIRQALPEQYEEAYPLDDLLPTAQ